MDSEKNYKIYKTLAIAVTLIIFILIWYFFVRQSGLLMLISAVIFPVIILGIVWKMDQRHQKILQKAREAWDQEQWRLHEPERLKQDEEQKKRFEREILWKPEIEKLKNLIRTVDSNDRSWDDGPGESDSSHKAYNQYLIDISGWKNEILEIGKKLYSAGGITMLQEVRDHLRKMGENWSCLQDYWKEIDSDFYEETWELSRQKR